MTFNGVRIKPAVGGAGGGITWPGDGSKLLSGDGSQVIVGDGLTLSGGTLTADGAAWPGTSSQMLAADGTSITVGDGLSLSAGTISSTNIKNTYVSSVGDSTVSLLLHMEGANNSTTFTDKSYSPKAATVSGNAKISTASSKFGSSSAAFDGNGDFISYAYSADFNLSGGDFTIEGWVNPSSLSSQMCVIAKHSNAIGADWMFYIDNSTTVSFYTNGTMYSRTVPTISAGTWYHFAIAKVSGVISIYWNGTRAGTTFTAATLNTAAALGIGADRPNSPQLYFNGYIDEIRVTKGLARYTTDFTPSASEFANADGSAELVASNVGDAIHAPDGIYICTSLSPLTWKKLSIASTITL